MASKTTIVLPKATANYVSVFKARKPPNAKDGDENQYTITLTYPKSEKAALAEVIRAVEEVAEAKWPGKGKQIVKGMKWPVIADGDERLSNSTGEPMFPGEFFIVAKRKESFGPPGVVDQRLRRIMDPSMIYAGSLVFVQVNLYPFAHPLGGKGVGVGLANVQLAGEGERRDGRQEPEEAFTAIDTGEDDAESLV